MTLLTNGGNTRDLYEDLYREIFAELSGVDMKHPVAVPEQPVEVDITPFVGTYERASVRMEVFVGDGGPDAAHHACSARSPNSSRTRSTSTRSSRSTSSLYAVRAPGTQTWITVTFYSLPTGEEYVHFGARATPKTSATRSPTAAAASAETRGAEKVAVPA